MPDSPVKISQETLQALGLDSKIVEKVQRERTEREQGILNSRQNGASLYKEFNSSHLPISEIKLAGGSLEIPPTNSLLDLLRLIRERARATQESPEASVILLQLKAFAEGIGNSALDQTDFETAVPFLDFISAEGILNNKEVITKIRTIVRDDPEELVKIAEIIEGAKQTQPPPAPAAPVPPQQAPTPPDQNPNPNPSYDINGNGLRPVPSPGPQVQPTRNF